MLEKRLGHRHSHHQRAILGGLLGDDNSSKTSGSGGSGSESSTDSSKSSTTESKSDSKTSASSKTSTSSSSTTPSSSSSSTPPPTSLSTDPDGGQAHTVTADTSNSSSSSSGSPTLGTGAIAGIAAGGAVAIIILAILIGCCVRRKAKTAKKPVVDPFNRHSFKHEGEIIPDPIETDYREPSPRPNMAGMGAAHTNYMPPPSLPGLAHIPRVETPQMLQSRSPFDPYGQHHQLQPPPHMMNVGMVPPYKPPSPSYFPNYSDALIPPQPPNLDRSPSVQSHSAHISSPPMYSPQDNSNTDFLPNPYENKTSNKGNDTTHATYRPASLRPAMHPPQSGNSRVSTSHNLDDAYSGI